MIYYYIYYVELNVFIPIQQCVSFPDVEALKLPSSKLSELAQIRLNDVYFVWPCAVKSAIKIIFLIIR